MTTHRRFASHQSTLRTALGALLAGLSLAVAAAPPSEDATFARKAAAGGLAEVQAGALAREKGASERVKQFGAHMTEDHSRANEELKALAASKDIALPSTPDAAHQKAKARLESQSGQSFDRAYRSQMVDDHKKTIALFEKQVRTGKDVELKAFAAKTLPSLREHLKMAQAL